MTRIISLGRDITLKNNRTVLVLGLIDAFPLVLYASTEISFLTKMDLGVIWK